MTIYRHSYKKYGNIIKRVVSAFVLTTLISTQVLAAPQTVLDSEGARPPHSPGRLDVTQMKIPHRIGTIGEFYRGGGDKVVVLIQDAHAISEAQENIRKLIAHLQNKYFINLIALEGASSALDPQILRSFPDKNVLRKTLEAYMQDGELTGGTAAAILNEQPGLYYGTEDWALYEEGLALYQAAAKREREILNRTAFFKKILNQQKKQHYSKELFEIDELLEKFYRERNDFSAVLERLARIAPPPAGSELALLAHEIKRTRESEVSVEREVGKIAEQMKKFLNGKELVKHIREQEKRAALDSFKFNEKFQEFQTGSMPAEAFAVFMRELAGKPTGRSSERFRFAVSPALGRLMKNYLRMRGIEGEKFFRNFERYAESVKESLFKTDIDRKLNFQTGGLYLAEKLAKLELSRQEWNEAKALIESAGNEGGFDEISFNAAIMQLLMLPAAFYQNAEKRDEALVRNLLSLMKKNGSNASVVVAGGFHTEGLVRLFRAHGISYLLVTPEISSVVENVQSQYRNQIKGEISWKDYLEIENGKIHLNKAFLRAVRDRLLGLGETYDAGNHREHGFDLFSGFRDRSSFVKAWRDQILRDLASNGQMGRAGEYSRFIDEVGKKGRSGSEPDEPMAYLSELRRRWFANIDRFIDNLRRLDQQRQRSGENILRLLAPSAIQPVKTGPAVLTSDALTADLKLSPAVLHELEISRRRIKKILFPAGKIDRPSADSGSPSRAESRGGQSMHMSLLARSVAGGLLRLQAQKGVPVRSIVRNFIAEYEAPAQQGWLAPLGDFFSRFWETADRKVVRRVIVSGGGKVRDTEFLKEILAALQADESKKKKRQKEGQARDVLIEIKKRLGQEPFSRLFTFSEAGGIRLKETATHRDVLYAAGALNDLELEIALRRGELPLEELDDLLGQVTAMIETAGREISEKKRRRESVRKKGYEIEIQHALAWAGERIQSPGFVLELQRALSRLVFMIETPAAGKSRSMYSHQAEWDRLIASLEDHLKKETARPLNLHKDLDLALALRDYFLSRSEIREGGDENISRLLGAIDEIRPNILRLIRRREFAPGFLKRGELVAEWQVMKDAFALFYALRQHEHPEVIRDIFGNWILAIDLMLARETWDFERIGNSFRSLFKEAARLKLIKQYGQLENIASYRKSSAGFDISRLKRSELRSAHSMPGLSDNDFLEIPAKDRKNFKESFLRFYKAMPVARHGTAQWFTEKAKESERDGIFTKAVSYHLSAIGSVVRQALDTSQQGQEQDEWIAQIKRNLESALSDIEDGFGRAVDDYQALKILNDYPHAVFSILVKKYREYLLIPPAPTPGRSTPDQPERAEIRMPALDMKRVNAVADQLEKDERIDGIVLNRVIAGTLEDEELGGKIKDVFRRSGFPIDKEDILRRFTIEEEFEYQLRFLLAISEELAARKTAGKLPPRSEVRNREKTILIVEDEALARRSLAYLLRAAGFVILEAGTVREALETMLVSKIDLLFTDFNLPDGDGGEIIGFGRNNDPSLPVVLMSGIIEQEGIKRTLASHQRIQTFSKPIPEIAELIPHLDQLLARGNEGFGGGGPQQISRAEKRNASFAIQESITRVKNLNEFGILSPREQSEKGLGILGGADYQITREANELNPRISLTALPLDSLYLSVEDIAEKAFMDMAAGVLQVILERPWDGNIALNVLEDEKLKTIVEDRALNTVIALIDYDRLSPGHQSDVSSEAFSPLRKITPEVLIDKKVHPEAVRFQVLFVPRDLDIRWEEVVDTSKVQIIFVDRAEEFLTLGRHGQQDRDIHVRIPDYRAALIQFLTPLKRELPDLSPRLFIHGVRLVAPSDLPHLGRHELRTSEVDPKKFEAFITSLENTNAFDGYLSPDESKFSFYASARRSGQRVFVIEARTSGPQARGKIWQQVEASVRDWGLLQDNGLDEWTTVVRLPLNALIVDKDLKEVILPKLADALISPLKENQPREYLFRMFQVLAGHSLTESRLRDVLKKRISYRHLSRGMERTLTEGILGTYGKDHVKISFPEAEDHGNPPQVILEVNSPWSILSGKLEEPLDHDLYRLTTLIREKYFPQYNMAGLDVRKTKIFPSTYNIQAKLRLQLWKKLPPGFRSVMDEYGMDRGEAPRIESDESPSPAIVPEDESESIHGFDVSVMGKMEDEGPEDPSDKIDLGGAWKSSVEDIGVENLLKAIETLLPLFAGNEPATDALLNLKSDLMDQELVSPHSLNRLKEFVVQARDAYLQPVRDDVQWDAYQEAFDYLDVFISPRSELRTDSMSPAKSIHDPAAVTPIKPIPGGLRVRREKLADISSVELSPAGIVMSQIEEILPRDMAQEQRRNGRLVLEAGTLLNDRGPKADWMVLSHQTVTPENLKAALITLKHNGIMIVAYPLTEAPDDLIALLAEANLHEVRMGVAEAGRLKASYLMAVNKTPPRSEKRPKNAAVLRWKSIVETPLRPETGITVQGVSVGKVEFVNTSPSTLRPMTKITLNDQIITGKTRRQLADNLSQAGIPALTVDSDPEYQKIVIGNEEARWNMPSELAPALAAYLTNRSELRTQEGYLSEPESGKGKTELDQKAEEIRSLRLSVMEIYRALSRYEKQRINADYSEMQKRAKQWLEKYRYQLSLRAPNDVLSEQIAQKLVQRAAPLISELSAFLTYLSTPSETAQTEAGSWNAPVPDYYEMLNVPPDADDETIKKAYRQLAMQYHPDRNAGDEAADKKIREIIEAYRVLMDPAKREEYDRLYRSEVREAKQPSRRDILRTTLAIAGLLASASVLSVPLPEELRRKAEREGLAREVEIYVKQFVNPAAGFRERESAWRRLEEISKREIPLLQWEASKYMDDEERRRLAGLNNVINEASEPGMKVVSQSLERYDEALRKQGGDRQKAAEIEKIRLAELRFGFAIMEREILRGWGNFAHWHDRVRADRDKLVKEWPLYVAYFDIARKYFFRNPGEKDAKVAERAQKNLKALSDKQPLPDREEFVEDFIRQVLRRFEEIKKEQEQEKEPRKEQNPEALPRPLQRRPAARLGRQEGRAFTTGLITNVVLALRPDRAGQITFSERDLEGMIRMDAEKLKSELKSKAEELLDLEDIAYFEEMRALDETLGQIQNKSLAIGVAFPDIFQDRHESWLSGFMEDLDKGSVKEFFVHNGRLPASWVQHLARNREIQLRRVAAAQTIVLKTNNQKKIPSAVFIKNSESVFPKEFWPVFMQGLEAIKDHRVLAWLGKLNSRALMHLADLEHLRDPELIQAELIKRLKLEGYEDVITLVRRGALQGFALNAALAQKVLEHRAQLYMRRSA